MIEQETFIGVVEARSSRGSIPSATLIPLYQLATDGLTWDQLDETGGRRVFPNSGRVSWIHVPDDLAEGTVWRFKVTTQPTYDDRPDDPRRDRYMVAHRSDRQLIEVLDVDQLGGEPLGREQLCTRGVRLDLSDFLYVCVRTEEKLWSFLPFVPKEGEPSLHVIEPSVLDQPLRFQTCNDANSTIELLIRGEPRTFLLPDAKIEGTVVLRDWSPDPIVLKRVMGKLRKWDRSFTDTLELSERALDRVEEILAAPPVNINDLDMERARFKRARAYLASLRDADTLKSAARIIVEEGPLATQIENEKEQILQAETSKAKEQAKEAIRAEREKLDQVKKLIAELEQERLRLRAEIDAVRQQQASFVERLDEEIESRLVRLLDKPEQVLADVAILKAVERVLSGTAPARRVDSAREIAASLEGSNENRPILGCSDLAEFSNLLQRALLENDTPPNAWRAILSSLLGGSVPLLMGARARSAFEAFARVATRGEIHWVQVEPTWACLRDAMEGGLAEQVRDLGGRAGLHLVVLEGVNRAPVESYLCSLLPVYSDAWESQGSVLPQLANGEMNGHLPRRPLRPWPKNVLLGGTLIDGITSLGLPTSCLEGCTLVFTDELRAGAELHLTSIHPALRGRKTSATTFGEVTVDTWSSWREHAMSVDLTAPIEKWRRLASEHDLSRLGRDRFLATYAASWLLASDDETATSDSIAYAALPLLAAGEQSFELNGPSFEYRDLDRVAELIGKLIRS